MTSTIAKRVAVVTGGNKGIGFEIVRKLAEHKDVETVLTARSEERGKAACEALSKQGVKVASQVISTAQFHRLDLDDKKSISEFGEWVTKTYGGLDILVNNAAIAFKGSDPTPFRDQADPTMKTNFWGTLDVMDELVPKIREGGNIVNVASQSGTSAYSKMSNEMKAKVANPSIDRETLCALATKFCEDVKAGRHQQEGWASSCYGTSKLFVIYMSKLFARKLESKNIACNSMCPGYCDTDMTSHKGPRSPAEGADTAAWLALQTNKDRPTGGFFKDRKALL